jgi:nucleoside-diphosphate-sugar epimerase
MKSALVLGAGGFIGSHLVARLKKEGYTLVCGVDLKYPEFSESKADEFIIADLRNQQECESLFDVYNWDEVYQLAADMGGAGYIFTGEHDADLMDNSAKINLNIAKLCVQNKVGKVFYSSSACMYPQEIQRISNNTGLKESDAYPANPDSEYGWEKLFSERLYLAYSRNYGLDVRIARFHNIYGIEGTYKGGREKAPAAMCRKVAEVKTEENIYEYSDGTKEAISQKNGEIEVWGDGLQTRSFLYIDECIEGIRRLMISDCKEPVNIGSDEMVSINELAQMAIDISGKKIQIKNIESKALGVRGRNSDNDFIYSQLGWKPNYPLQKGMEKTFEWISKQVYNNL